MRHDPAKARLSCPGPGDSDSGSQYLRGQHVVGLLHEGSRGCNEERCRCHTNVDILHLPAAYISHTHTHSNALVFCVPEQACYHAFQCLLLAGREPDEAQQSQVLNGLILSRNAVACRCHPGVRYFNIFAAWSTWPGSTLATPCT